MRSQTLLVLRLSSKTSLRSREIQLEEPVEEIDQPLLLELRATLLPLLTNHNAVVNDEKSLKGFLVW